MSPTGTKKHKFYSLYHNLFKLLCTWPLEVIYKSRFIKKSPLDTTRSNAFESQKGRASFLLHLSIQKRNILIGLLQSTRKVLTGKTQKLKKTPDKEFSS